MSFEDTFETEVADTFGDLGPEGAPLADDAGRRRGGGGGRGRSGGGGRGRGRS